MNCSRKNVLLLFAAFWISGGCGKSRVVSTSKEQLPATNVTGHVEGSVFIVTKGRVNIKLGAINVLVFTSDQMANIESRALPRIKAAKDRFTNEIAKLHVTQESLAVERNKIEKGAFRLLAEYQRLDSIATDLLQKGDNRWQGVSQQANKFLSNRKIQADKAENLSKLMQEASLARAKIAEDWPTMGVEFYFDDLPIAFANCLTDAEGKFTFDLPAKNKYVVMARSNRETFADSPEKYFWAVKLELGLGETTRLLLSNHNMVSSLSPNSAIQYELWGSDN